jgi:hypothetical protein
MGVTPGRAEPRFPGYEVADEASTWDPVTRRVVLGRLEQPEPLRFFEPHEAAIAHALLDRLLAQDHEPRVPVVEPIDRRLAEGDGDGYRFADMPEDGEAWRRSLAALDADAREQHGRDFVELTRDAQVRIIESVRTADGPWHGLPGSRVFSLWMRYGCGAFYSHPWAWNEIGFGGPAYPRGYKNLGLDRREPWEVKERHAEDPIPWVARAEAARGRHRDALANNQTPTRTGARRQ